MNDRPPPVRLGRIWHRDPYGAIYSDCTLIGGDSGGPLFDLDGRVIGIHSSIGGSLATNRHVATDSFRLHWNRMLQEETWGTLHLDPDQGDLATMGVELDWASRDGARVRAVRLNAPAAAAGLQEGDLIVKFAGEAIASSIQLLRQLAEMRAGDEAAVAVNRSGEVVDLKVKLTDFKSLTTPPERDDETVADAPYLGVEVESPASGEGALITAVAESSPAATAGLTPGDIITAMDDNAIESPAAFITLILKRLPGDSVTLTVRRTDDSRTVTIELGSQ